MPGQHIDGRIITLKDVETFLAHHDMLHLEISRDKVEELYDLIDDHGYLFLRDPEASWAVCEDEDAHRMASMEINGLLELDSSVMHEHLTLVGAVISNICRQFDQLSRKDKIAFYIIVLDRLT